MSPTGKSKVHPSPVLKRSIVIEGHKTSVSLEDVFWKALKGVQAEHNRDLQDGDPRENLGDLVAIIDARKPKGTNLSCALRLFVVDRLQQEIQTLSLTLATVMHKKAA